MAESGLLIVGYDEVFLAEAIACLERCREGSEAKDSTLVGGAAASAIVASCTAVEAFVSERTTYHERARNLDAEAVDGIRKADGLHRKLNRLVKAFHPGGLETLRRYQDLAALVSLRGCIVHRHARYLDTKAWPEDLEAHRARVPHLTQDGLDWTSRVLNPKTAGWAVGTAETILEEASKHIPRSPKGLIVAVGVVDGTVTGDSVAEKQVPQVDDPK